MMSSVSYEVPRTSDIPFFSSLHGRAQREMRGIERRDLQGVLACMIYCISVFWYVFLRNSISKSTCQRSPCYVENAKKSQVLPTCVLQLQILAACSASRLPSSCWCMACPGGEVGSARVPDVLHSLVGLSSCRFAGQTSSITEVVTKRYR